MTKHFAPDLMTSVDVSRFWGKVDKSTECWKWTAAKNTQGYGILALAREGKRITLRAHRVAYQLHTGDSRQAIEVDHICHTAECVNPDHLRPTSPKQNQENRRGPNASSTSGVLGVSWLPKRRRWLARVQHAGRRVYAGQFMNRSEAEAAATAKRIELYTHNDHDRMRIA